MSGADFEIKDVINFTFEGQEVREYVFSVSGKLSYVQELGISGRDDKEIEASAFDRMERHIAFNNAEKAKAEG